MSDYTTVFGALADYRKGGVQVIDDDPKNYAFSNVFEVANQSSAYERVAVGKNFEYVIEAVCAEGTSAWYSAAHDEFALCLDGRVEVQLVKPDQFLVDADQQGASQLEDNPDGAKMGRIVLGQGHMALLPANAAYRFHADKASAMVIQTKQGPVTVEKWSDICQTENESVDAAEELEA